MMSLPPDCGWLGAGETGSRSGSDSVGILTSAGILVVYMKVACPFGHVASWNTSLHPLHHRAAMVGCVATCVPSLAARMLPRCVQKSADTMHAVHGRPRKYTAVRSVRCNLTMPGGNLTMPRRGPRQCLTTQCAINALHRQVRSIVNLHRRLPGDRLELIWPRLHRIWPRRVERLPEESPRTTTSTAVHVHVYSCTGTSTTSYPIVVGIELLVLLESRDAS